MGDEKKSTVDVMPVMAKITEHKLSPTNYLDWRQTIELYLLSVSMDGHMTDDPPTDDAKKLPWLREDARLFLQIRNCISSEVIGMVTHCRTVKALLSYLEFLYSGKGNVSRIYDVCQAFYRPEKGDRPITDYFMEFKKTYEELNVLLPFSPDVSVQHSQREKMAVMSFLAGLPPEFETAKSQILSDSQISSLEEAYSRILRTERTSSATSSQPNSVLFSRAPTYESRKPQYKSGGNKGNQGQWSADVECRYCHGIGHIKRDCPKLRNKKPPSSAHVAASSSNSGRSSEPVTISADEYAKLLQSQASSVATIAESGSGHEEDYW